MTHSAVNPSTAEHEAPKKKFCEFLLAPSPGKPVESSTLEDPLRYCRLTPKQALRRARCYSCDTYETPDGPVQVCELVRLIPPERGGTFHLRESAKDCQRILQESLRSLEDEPYWRP